MATLLLSPPDELLVLLSGTTLIAALLGSVGPGFFWSLALVVAVMVLLAAFVNPWERLR